MPRRLHPPSLTGGDQAFWLQVKCLGRNRLSLKEHVSVLINRVLVRILATGSRCERVEGRLSLVEEIHGNIRFFLLAAILRIEGKLLLVLILGR